VQKYLTMFKSQLGGTVCMSVCVCVHACVCVCARARIVLMEPRDSSVLDKHSIMSLSYIP
jgi:hypothetical protein